MNNIDEAAKAFARKRLIFTDDCVDYNKEMHAAFLAGNRFQAEKPIGNIEGMWIDVYEDRPDFGQGVLVAINTGLITVGYRVKTKLGYNWQLFGDVDISLVVDLENEFVTHWMPLPTPPLNQQKQTV